MARSGSQLGLTLAAALVAALLLVRYQAAAERYPFYLAWDMDLVTSLDLLAIHDGALPDQVHHPGLGMYLALSAQQRVAHAAGQPGALRLSEALESLDPLAVMADHATQLRRLSPRVCLALVLAWWGALLVTLRPPAPVALALLLFLGLQDGLLYQACYVRSDLYAAAYLALALALAAAWRAGGLARGRRWLGPLVGLLVGLAVLSKVQVLACCALVPILLAWAPPRGPEAGSTSPPGRAATGVGAATWLAFSALILVASAYEVQAGSVTYTRTWELGLVGVAVWGGMTALVALQAAGRLDPRVPEAWVRAADHLAFVAAGFVAAFATPLLLYDDLGTGLDDALLVAKLTFWRGAAAYWGDGSDPSRFNHAPGSSLLESLGYQPDAYLGLLGAGALLLLAWRQGWGRVGRGHALAFAGVLAITAVQLGLATRPVLRDLLWLDLLLATGLALALVHVGLAAQRRRKAQVAACLLLGALALRGELRRVSALRERVEAYSELDGWQPWRWLFGWYPTGNSARYRAALEDHYTVDRAGEALRAAERVEEDVLAARFAFPELALGPRHVGRLGVGWPVSVADPAARLVAVPEPLAGALLVDGASQPAIAASFPRPDTPAHYTELDGRQPKRPGVVVRQRADRNLVLFVRAAAADAVVAAAGGALSRTPFEVEVGGRAEPYRGLLLLASARLVLPPGPAAWFAALVLPDTSPRPGRGASLAALEPAWPLSPLSVRQAADFARRLRESPSRWERLYSAHCLGRVGPEPEAAAALRGALADPDPAVRLEATRALATAGAGEPASREALEALQATDPDPRVRDAAARACAAWPR